MKNAYDNKLYSFLLHFFLILQEGKLCTEGKTKTVYTMFQTIRYNKISQNAKCPEE